MIILKLDNDPSGNFTALHGCEDAIDIVQGLQFVMALDFSSGGHVKRFDSVLSITDSRPHNF